MIRSCVCLSQSVSGLQCNPSENALLATFMVVCAAFCVIYHVIVFSVQLYLHRDAHQQESCSIVFVSTVGYHCNTLGHNHAVINTSWINT